VEHITHFVNLWELLQDITLTPGIEDTIVWTLTSNGSYSTRSAYRAQFLGSSSSSFEKMVSRACAPPQCHFFAWLVMQNRLWTSDHLAKHGWPHQAISSYASVSLRPLDTFFSSVDTPEGCGRRRHLGFHAPPFCRTWGLTGLPSSNIGMPSLVTDGRT
jgi:hypothetical protein